MPFKARAFENDVEGYGYRPSVKHKVMMHDPKCQSFIFSY